MGVNVRSIVMPLDARERRTAWAAGRQLLRPVPQTKDARGATSRLAPRTPGQTCAPQRWL